MSMIGTAIGQTQMLKEELVRQAFFKHEVNGYTVNIGMSNYVYSTLEEALNKLREHFSAQV